VKNKVLVAGASGLIGAAGIETFLAAGWDVIGISRRKPQLPSGRDFRFIPVDLRDEKGAGQALSPLADVTHVASPVPRPSRALEGIETKIGNIGHVRFGFFT
jgi:nucleoside-diphosphate-sugar epimerase